MSRPQSSQCETCDLLGYPCVDHAPRPKRSRIDYGATFGRRCPTCDAEPYKGCRSKTGLVTTTHRTRVVNREGF